MDCHAFVNDSTLIGRYRDAARDVETALVGNRHEVVLSVELQCTADFTLGPFRTAHDSAVVAPPRGIVRDRSLAFIEGPAAYEAAGEVMGRVAGGTGLRRHGEIGRSLIGAICSLTRTVMSPQIQHRG
jgi:hypothetical protein